jgi:hypothetical protein
MFAENRILSRLMLPFSKFYRCLSFPEILRFQEPDITNNSPRCHKTAQVTCKWLPGKHIKWSNTWKKNKGISVKKANSYSNFVSLLLTIPESINKYFIIFDCYWTYSRAKLKSTLKNTKKQFNLMLSMRQEPKMSKYMSCNTWLISLICFNHIVYRVKRKDSFSFFWTVISLNNLLYMQRTLV